MQYVQTEVRVAVRNRVRKANHATHPLRWGYCKFPFQDWLKEQNNPGVDMYVGIELVVVYRAKSSAAALCLKGKKNPLRLQQDFSLTEAEANAVEDGVNALKSSSHSLQTPRLRRGPTPRHLQSELVRIQPTNGGSN